MIAQATHVVDVLRGGGVSFYGDPVDTDTVVVAGVPMSILESSRNTTTHADDRLQTVTALIGRCNREVDVRQGDRLRTAGGRVFQVASVSRPVSSVMAADARLDLTWVRLPDTLSGASVIGVATLPFEIGN